MIVYNLIFWAGCPSGAPHAPCKSSGVQFLWLAGLFFPCPLLTGSWLSRELLSEDSPGQSHQKTCNSVLISQNATARARLPSTHSFGGSGAAPACSQPLFSAYAPPHPSAPFPESGLSHPLVASPDALEKRQFNTALSGFQLFLGYCSYLLV